MLLPDSIQCSHTTGGGLHENEREEHSNTFKPELQIVTKRCYDFLLVKVIFRAYGTQFTQKSLSENNSTYFGFRVVKYNKNS